MTPIDIVAFQRGFPGIFFCICSPVLGLEKHAYLGTLLLPQPLCSPCRTLHHPVYPRTCFLALFLHKWYLRHMDSHDSQCYSSDCMLRTFKRQNLCNLLREAECFSLFKEKKFICLHDAAISILGMNCRVSMLKLFK